MMSNTLITTVLIILVTGPLLQASEKKDDAKSAKAPVTFHPRALSIKSHTEEAATIRDLLAWRKRIVTASAEDKPKLAKQFSHADFTAKFLSYWDANTKLTRDGKPAYIVPLDKKLKATVSYKCAAGKSKIVSKGFLIPDYWKPGEDLVFSVYSAESHLGGPKVIGLGLHDEELVKDWRHPSEIALADSLARTRRNSDEDGKSGVPSRKSSDEDDATA